MSAHGRSARGKAAETAASPPTRTKSSISVVTNRTFKKQPPYREPGLLLCKNGSNFRDAAPPQKPAWRNTSPSLRRNLGSDDAPPRARVAKGAFENDNIRQG